MAWLAGVGRHVSGVRLADSSCWRRAPSQAEAREAVPEEEAKKTETCKAAGLGEVPTTTTPVPAPGTATTPRTRDARRHRRPRRGPPPGRARADDVDADAGHDAADACTARPRRPGARGAGHAADARTAGGAAPASGARRHGRRLDDVAPPQQTPVSPVNAARNATSTATRLAVPHERPVEGARPARPDRVDRAPSALRSSSRSRAGGPRHGLEPATLVGERAHEAFDHERVEDADADRQGRSPGERAEQDAERGPPARTSQPAAIARTSSHADGSRRERPRSRR